jgi:hypothetical protein
MPAMKAATPATELVNRGRGDEQLGGKLGVEVNHNKVKFQPAPISWDRPRTRGGFRLLQVYHVDRRIADAVADAIGIGPQSDFSIEGR